MMDKVDMCSQRTYFPFGSPSRTVLLLFLHTIVLAKIVFEDSISTDLVKMHSVSLVIFHLNGSNHGATQIC